jgi:hypothetical protein
MPPLQLRRSHLFWCWLEQTPKIWIPTYSCAARGARTGRQRAFARRATEFLPGYEANGWYGIVTPRHTPAISALGLNIDPGLLHLSMNL